MESFGFWSKDSQKASIQFWKTKTHKRQQWRSLYPAWANLSWRRSDKWRCLYSNTRIMLVNGYDRGCQRQSIWRMDDICFWVLRFRCKSAHSPYLYQLKPFFLRLTLAHIISKLLSGNLLASKKYYWFLPKNSDIILGTYFFFKDIFIYYINSEELKYQNLVAFFCVFF